MKYCVSHELGLSLVRAKSEKQAEEFIRKEFGRHVEPIKVDQKQIGVAEAFGAFVYDA